MSIRCRICHGMDTAFCDPDMPQICDSCVQCSITICQVCHENLSTYAARGLEVGFECHICSECFHTADECGGGYLLFGYATCNECRARHATQCCECMRSATEENALVKCSACEVFFHVSCGRGSLCLACDSDSDDNEI